MKKVALFLFVQFCATSLLAQEAVSKKWFLEVNKDVWLPFIESWATNDVEKYNGLHTKDLIRGGEKEVQGFESYAEHNRRNFKQRITNKAKVTIDFRLLERANNGELGSERGIYETTYTNQKGEVFKNYGKFHVFLRKVEGVWKIAVDYDSDENNTITQDSFKAASAIDDFSKD
jgi:ketosteroid isomerase-like protein